MIGRVGRVVLVAVALVTGTTACAGTGGGTAASCVAPEVTATPTTAHPGDTITVTGHWLRTTCNDTGQGPDEPATGIRVTLHGEDAAYESPLGTMDADDALTASVTVTVPTDAPVGHATVTLDDDDLIRADPVPIEITAG